MKKENSSPDIRQQKTSDGMWKNENGIEIPVNRITATEKVMERVSFRMFRDALVLHEELVQFKEDIRKQCDEIYTKAMEDNKVKKGKGNFTFYNFDRSIRMEVSINENIMFDDVLIQACQAKLNEFLNDKLSDKDEFVRQLVMDAFSKTRGALDARKVMSLLRHRSKIKAKAFQEACNLLEESIRRPDSRTYFRVSYELRIGKIEIYNVLGQKASPPTPLQKRGERLSGNSSLNCV